MIPRYSTPEMTEIWSDISKWGRFVEVEVLATEAHAEIGGVAGALAQHAEATLGQVGAERQPMVREIFRNLVTAQGTRAARDSEELLSVFAEREAAEGARQRRLHRLGATQERTARQGAAERLEKPSAARSRICHPSPRK